MLRRIDLFSSDIGDEIAKRTANVSPGCGTVADSLGVGSVGSVVLWKRRFKSASPLALILTSRCIGHV